MTYADLHLAGGNVHALPQDVRDYVFGSTAPDNKTIDFEWAMDRLPESIDLRGEAVHVHAQNGGSCVGQSTVECCEILYNTTGDAIALSPQFVYYNARKRLADLTKQPVQDAGTSVWIAMATTTMQGIALDALCPNVGDLNAEPVPSAYTDGLTRLVGRYERLGYDSATISRNKLNDIKVALASGMPVVFATPLHVDFYSINGPIETHVKQYAWPTVDTSSSNFVGHHAMCIVGYTPDYLIVSNSWGEGWGDGGYWGMPYQCLGGAFDIFTIREFAGTTFEIPDAYRKQIQPVDSNWAKAYRLYRAAFARKPDVAGLHYWVDVLNQGADLRRVAECFIDSEEFRALYPNGGNKDFVTALYKNVLGREPDLAGLAYWVGRLVVGTARAELLVGFSESDENKTGAGW